MNGGKTGEAGQLFQSALSVVVTRTTRPRSWPRVGGVLAGRRPPLQHRRPARRPGRLRAWRPGPCRAARPARTTAACAGSPLTAGSALRNLRKWAASSISRGRESVNALNAGSRSRSDSSVKLIGIGARCRSASRRGGRAAGRRRAVRACRCRRPRSTRSPTAKTTPPPRRTWLSSRCASAVGEARHVAQENAVVGRQVAQPLVGELRLGDDLGPGDDVVLAGGRLVLEGVQGGADVLGRLVEGLAGRLAVDQQHRHACP